MVKALCQKQTVNEAESDLLKNNYNTGLKQFVKSYVNLWNDNSEQEKYRSYFSQVF